jgi:dTDP-glucose pyrophosphorylase/predicted transcriptional regulator
MQLIEKLDNICVSEDISLREALVQMDNNGLQILLVNNKEGKLSGVITDGDVRRYILGDGVIDVKVREISNPDYMALQKDRIVEAAEIIHSHGFNHLPIIDNDGYVRSLAVGVGVFYNLDQNKNIPVVIMAGGKGTRLSPLTRIVPKPLVPVGEVTMLEKIIGNFYDQGFDDFRVIVNYKKELIRSYMGEVEHPYNIEFIDEDDYCGTVGGLKLLKSSLEGTFVLTNCDIIATLNYQALLDWHQEHEAEVTIMGVRKRTDIPYGVVTVDKESYVTELEEKPFYHHVIVSGVYVLNTTVLDFIPEGESFGMDQLIDKLLENGVNVTCYPIEDGWFDMGQFEEYRKLLHHFGEI